MEKPVRILEVETIRDFNDRVRNGLAYALNFMFATDEESKILISPMEAFLMSAEAYNSLYKKKSIMLKVHADNALSGELYWFFELNTGIILGSLLRQLTPSALAEKISRQNFDSLDQDSFGEVGNQLCGILDRAFRALSNKDVHLRLDFEKKVYLEDSVNIEGLKNQEEFVVLLSSIAIPNHPIEKLTLLLPRSIYEGLLSLEVQIVGVDLKTVILYTWNEAQAAVLNKKLNTRYSKILFAKEPDDLFSMLDQKKLVAVGMDLRELKFPLSHQDTIFIKRLITNKALAKIPFFFSFADSTDAELAVLKGMGLVAAKNVNLEKHFAAWCQVFLQDPSLKI